jgi:alkylated DNA nucleotide flippase Atl1
LVLVIEETMATSDAGFAGRVRHVVAALGAGDVASYGEVAVCAGRPGAARAVGSVLAHSEGLPWWRVVNATGRLKPGDEHAQARLLAKENVVVRADHVVGFRRRRSRATTRVRRSIPGSAPAASSG